MGKEGQSITRQPGSTIQGVTRRQGPRGVVSLWAPCAAVIYREGHGSPVTRDQARLESLAKMM
jgi:hypothetical protein